MNNMHIFGRQVNGRRYRIAAQSVWDAKRGRSVARQVVLGPAEPPRVADLGSTQTVGTRGVGDVGALIWVAEQLDLVGQIDRACPGVGAQGGPTVGELAVAVAIQRACAPGPKCELGEFLDGSLPRLSCLPGSAFTGQAFHRVAQQVTDAQLDTRSRLELRVKKALAREHLSSFVVATVAGSEAAPTLQWHVDAALRRELERTRLGKRVLCTDRHNWSTGRIVHAFRGQWNVEELFRRAKKGGVVPWGPSHQWADGSLRLHTFATVLGLMLVSLARIALGSDASARRMMEGLAEIKVTLVKTKTGAAGRRPTAMLAPELTAEQRRAVKLFELDRWAPTLFHVAN